MTDPETTPTGAAPPPPERDAAPAPPESSAAQAGSTSQLAQYFAANRARFTEEALADSARKSGHSDATIQAAMAESRAAEATEPLRGRAIRAIVIAYLAIYALLSFGMLANSGQPAGYLMPSAAGGIVILTGSLVVTFVASMIWVASRRAFGFLFFLGLTLWAFPLGMSFVANPEFNTPAVLIPTAIGILGMIWLWRGRNAGATGGQPGMEVLLVVPILLLLGVAGLCVATGLPIPRAA